MNPLAFEDLRLWRDSVRKENPRWPQEKIDELKLRLNQNGMALVSDAIGSLEFDEVERRVERDKFRAERDKALVLLRAARPYLRELGRPLKLMQDIDNLIGKEGQ